MADSKKLPSFPSEILESMKDFFENEESYHQAHTDILDIFDSVKWLSDFSKDHRWSNLDELETAMVEVNIAFIDHIEYHVKSLKRNMKYALKKIDKQQK